MNRWVALLLAVIGGAAIAYALTLAIFGGIAGFLWLFVFGDDPWPAWSDWVLGALILGGGLALWVLAGWQIWLRVRPR